MSLEMQLAIARRRGEVGVTGSGFIATPPAPALPTPAPTPSLPGPGIPAGEVRDTRFRQAIQAPAGATFGGSAGSRYFGEGER